MLLYDALYRFLHGLDTPASEVGPALRIEVRRNRRQRGLPDGTVLRSGDRIGAIHLNNTRLAALHGDGSSSRAPGLELRRQVLASLRALARLAGPSGPLSDIEAFTATTVFHQGLERLGFQAEAGGVLWPRLGALYQRVLLASIHPVGAARLRHARYRRARRLWISRAHLAARYGTPAPLGPVRAC